MSKGMQINFLTDLEPLSFESVQMLFPYGVLLCWSEKTLIMSNAQTLLNCPYILALKPMNPHPINYFLLTRTLIYYCKLYL